MQGGLQGWGAPRQSEAFKVPETPRPPSQEVLIPQGRVEKAGCLFFPRQDLGVEDRPLS